MNKFATIILPEAQCVVANNLAGCLGNGGENTFTRRIRPIGDTSEGTHRIMSGVVHERLIAALKDPEALKPVVEKEAARLGKQLTATIQDRAAVKNAAIISDEDPHVLMKQQGFEFVPEPDDSKVSVPKDERV
jgi:hypothetical protein